MTVYVSAKQSRNKAVHFYLRWIVAGKWSYMGLFKTEPDPTKASLRDWKRRAATAAADKQCELEGPPPERVGPVPTVADAVEAYLNDAATSLSPQTVANREPVLFRFLDGLPGKGAIKLYDLTTKHVNGWNGEPGYQGRRNGEVAADTLRREVGEIIAFAKWSSRTYAWPMPDLKLPPSGDRATPSLIGDEALRTIIKPLSGMRRDVVTMLAVSGVRQGELRGLSVKDYDPTGVIVLPPGQWARTKCHARRVPLGRRGMEICLDYAKEKAPGDVLFDLDGHPLAGQINRWLRPPGPIPHDLRRWFLSSLVRVGCPDKWVDALAGHRHGTDGRYVLPTDEELRAYVQAVEDRLFTPSSAGLITEVSPESVDASVAQ
jgi:integrase